MKDWIAYLKECVNSDLWGCVLLDYYHHQKEQGAKESPSNFINAVISEMPKEVIDPVAFHNTLLSVCVHLLTPDFPDIIQKSISWIKDLQNPLREEQLQSIIQHYSVYNKEAVFEQKLASSSLGTTKILKPNDRIDEEPEGFHQELPSGFLGNPLNSTDLLRYYSSEIFSKSQPFAGKRVLFVLHFLRDLVSFVEAAKRLGLDMENASFFYKEYPYPQRKSIKHWLERQSEVVKPRSYIPQYLQQLVDSPSESIGEILIVEDGGFFAPAIHREFTKLIPHVVGAVEQTSRGIRNAENWEKGKDRNALQFPIISVATSKLKEEFEPPYIADAVVDNIKRLLPNIPLRGSKVALLGCGPIGRAIAMWLSQIGANLIIFEPSSERELWAQQKGFNRAESSRQAVQNKTFVIGASGEESIDSPVIANLTHGTYLISASSELYEIDMDELQGQKIEMKPLRNDSDDYIGTDFILPPNDRTVHVLANGYPVNFWGFESMPEPASDLILSLILLSAAEVASGNYSTHGINSNAVNQIAEKYQIAKKFLEFYK